MSAGGATRPHNGATGSAIRICGSEKVKTPSAGKKKGASHKCTNPCAARSASHHSDQIFNTGTVDSCSVPRGTADVSDRTNGQVAIRAAKRELMATTAPHTRLLTLKRSMTAAAGGAV